MADENTAAMNKYKRPHYTSGDIIRIVAPGTYQGWQATVEGCDPVMTIAGTVVTYMYRVRTANQGIQHWQEESLAPLPESEEAQ